MDRSVIISVISLLFNLNLTITNLKTGGQCLISCSVTAQKCNEEAFHLLRRILADAK